MIPVFNVANFFLSMEKEGDSDITNLKLQKLCYYAQGVFMALNNGEPLFEEELLRWEHGPVCEELYHEYKSNGANVIPQVCDNNVDDMPEEMIEILDDVYSYFGQFSAWKLRNMTHEEAPWLNTGDSQIIDKNEIFTYFKNHVIDG